MKKKIEYFNRQPTFDFYKDKTNPFSIVTTKIDITNIYKLCKKYKHIYATIGYYFTKAMNEVEQFKYTYENGIIYKGERIHPSFTEIREDKSIGFFSCPLIDNYESFIEEYKKRRQSFLDGDVIEEIDDDAVVWLSCEPWFNFSQVVPPFDRYTTIPQMIWDRFQFDNDRCYVNLMIFVHHGFADGYHIGLLINKIEELISLIVV